MILYINAWVYHPKGLQKCMILSTTKAEIVEPYKTQETKAFPLIYLKTLIFLKNSVKVYTDSAIWSSLYMYLGGGSL